MFYQGIIEAPLANGQKAAYPKAGPVEICWKDRHISCNAMVIPDAPDILLGAKILEAMY